MTEDITINTKVERLTDGKWLDISTEYETNVAYPLQINDTLDETLDNASFEMISQRKELYPKFSKYKITLTDKQGDTLVRYYYGNDSVQQYTYCKPLYYKHSITLIEPTTMLQRLFVYGKSFTQPTGWAHYYYYIEDMIAVLLDVTPLHAVGTPQTYVLDRSIVNRLHAVTPPEFSWSNRVTLYEALQDIGYAVGGIPRLIPSKDDDTIWNLITFDFYEDDQGELEDIKYTDYNADLNMDYCASDLVTSAENVVTNIPITVPSKEGWVSVRNESTKITDSSSYIELPSGIERISRVKMFLPKGSFKFKVYYKDTQGYEHESPGFLTDVGMEIDITKWVVSSGEFDLLPEEYTYNSKNKQNVFTWAHGDNKITNVCEVYKKPLTLIRKVYEQVVKSVLMNHEITVSDRDGSTGNLITGRCVEITPGKGEPTYRVEYYPCSANVVFTTRKTNRNTKKVNQVAYNQSAEVVSAEKLGKNARAAAKRVGNAEMKLSTFSYNIADLPKCGQTYQGYKITNVSYQVSDIHKIDVLLELSENYTRANERIAVDRRYRQFAIPQDYVQRKIHRDYYISFDKTFKSQANDDALSLARNIFCGINPADILTNMYIEINRIKLVPTCNRYLFGNSMLFSFTMASNMVAGRKRNDHTNADIFYCDSDGMVDKVKFGLTSDPMENISKDMYPKTKMNISNVKFLEEYTIHKDAGEQLSFEIQIHFVSDDFIITPCATEYAMLGRTGAAHLKVIKNRLWGEILSERDMVSTDMEMDYPDGKEPIIRLTNLPKDGKGWAITSSTGEIVIGQKIKMENIDKIDVFVSSY